MIQTLIALRHAEAIPAHPGQADPSRELSTKGNAQAQELARVLPAVLGEQPTLVSSPAVRTRATAEPLATAVGFSVTLDDRIYDGGVQAWLEAVQTAPGEVLCVVGHQPTVSQVLMELDPNVGLVDRFPPASFAILRRRGDHDWELESISECAI